MNLEQVRGRATITVPEAGQLLSIGRDAAYAAAERGELPVLRLGRRLVVPVPRLLELLGMPQTDSEASSREELATASTPDSSQEPRHVQSHACSAPTSSNVRPLRGV